MSCATRFNPLQTFIAAGNVARRKLTRKSLSVVLQLHLHHVIHLLFSRELREAGVLGFAPTSSFVAGTGERGGGPRASCDATMYWAITADFAVR